MRSLLTYALPYLTRNWLACGPLVATGPGDSEVLDNAPKRDETETVGYQHKATLNVAKQPSRKQHNGNRTDIQRPVARRPR